MPPRDELDELDFQILERLQLDARCSLTEIGRVVSLSPPSVHQRIRRMEEQGVIEGYTTRIDPPKVGYGIQAWVEISLSLHEVRAIEQFQKAIVRIPEVLECYHVSGEFDFLAKVAARSMADYQRFVSERLSAIKGVGKIQTCFVMGVPKSHGHLVLR